MNIRDAIAYYKDSFAKCWDDEKYKWVAVQHFQDSWDIDAEDFAAMLEESFSQTYNLLQGGMYYANKMLCAQILRKCVACSVCSTMRVCLWLIVFSRFGLDILSRKELRTTQTVARSSFGLFYYIIFALLYAIPWGQLHPDHT